MRKKLLSILAVFALGLALVPAVMAATQGSCSPGVTSSSVLLFENSLGDTSDGDDRLWAFCNTGASSIGNLSTVVHTPAGTCKANFKLNDDWNDCVNRAQISLPNSQWRACFYKDSNFGGGVIGELQGPRASYTYTFSQGDALTSLRIRFLSTSC